MHDKPPQPETEAELEAFRQRWREEVSARNKQPGRPSSSRQSTLPAAPPRKPKISTGPLPHSASLVAGPSRREAADGSDEVEPKTYHDLPDREDALRLGTEGQDHDRNARPAEPSTALEHYERAVDKETSGQLGDSIRHYRKAFKVRLLPPYLLFSSSVLKVSCSLTRMSMKPTNRSTFLLPLS